MARVFARLKLRLLVNGIRGRRAVLFWLGAVGAAYLALNGFALLAASGSTAHARDLTVVIFSSVTAGWVFLPILMFGSDETLDPQRLATVPLTRRALMGGLLVAALVGIGPLATLVGLAGALVGLPHDPAQAVLVLAAVVGTLLLAVVGSRAFVSALTRTLRSRRARDVTIMLVALVGLLPQAVRLLVVGAGGGSDALGDTARWIRFTPFAIGGDAAVAASQGRLLDAVGLLVVLALVVALLLGVWSFFLERLMTRADPAGAPRAHGTEHGANPLFPRLARFLPADRMGAVAAKDLRYAARDPRRRVALVSALVLPGVILFSFARQGSGLAPEATFAALFATLAVGQLAANQFGLDGAALWSQLVAGNDPRADLTGKNVAVTLVVLPLTVLVALVLAALSSGWAYVPVTLGLALAAIGVELAVCNYVSVRAPFALPTDRRSPFAGSTGQGCSAAITSLGTLAAEVVILAPVGLAAYGALSAWSVTTATVAIVPLAVAYGAGAWLVGRRAAWRRMYWRLPELLTAVSPREAG